MGIVAAPNRNVGTTLLGTIVVSVVWCTVAEKVSLRAHHCGQESLVAREKKRIPIRYGDTGSLYSICDSINSLSPYSCLSQCTAQTRILAKIPKNRQKKENIKPPYSHFSKGRDQKPSFSNRRDPEGLTGCKRGKSHGSKKLPAGVINFGLL